DAVPRNVSGTAWHEPRWQGADGGHLDARRLRHPQRRDRQASQRRRHARRRRPWHGDARRYSGPRDRCTAARGEPAAAPDEPTRPQEFEGRTIPEVLTSGNHKEISAWRRAEAERLTRQRRPDLLLKSGKPDGRK